MRAGVNDKKSRNAVSEKLGPHGCRRVVEGGSMLKEREREIEREREKEREREYRRVGKSCGNQHQIAVMCRGPQRHCVCVLVVESEVIMESEGMM